MKGLGFLRFRVQGLGFSVVVLVPMYSYGTGYLKPTSRLCLQ